MLPYKLTPQSEEDIKDIARYTLKQWGKKQSMHYAGLLEKHFRKITSKSVYSRNFSERYPQVLLSHCEHHYIFHIQSDKKPPIIIAVLHERMDMLVRLKNRLDAP